MAKAKDDIISVAEVQKESILVHVLGTSPLICHRMSEKVKRELLLPKGKKTAADKAATAKHNPLQEFRDSPYTLREDDNPTWIGFLASAFKSAMRTAAIDVPGAKGAQIGRLVYVDGDKIPIFGIPEVFCAVTRSSDMNRTPDVRTRAIIRHWAAILPISFVSPIIKANAVINLLAAGGISAGIGDWRPEKGKGSYGQFKIVNDDDPQFVQVVREGGRAAQIAAMEQPAAYDNEAADLLSWFEVEYKTRGFK